MKKTYTSPALRLYGSLVDRTAADFSSTSTDGIFLAQQQVGTATGSLDACIFRPQKGRLPQPPPPGARCI